MGRREIEDFGFSAVDEIPNEPVIVNESNPAIEDKLNMIMNRIEDLDGKLAEPHGNIDGDELLKQKLKEMEDLIVPMLEGLAQNSDKPYIHWPNRKPLLEEKIRQVKKISGSL